MVGSQESQQREVMGRLPCMHLIRNPILSRSQRRPPLYPEDERSRAHRSDPTDIQHLPTDLTFPPVSFDQLFSNRKCCL